MEALVIDYTEKLLLALTGGLLLIQALYYLCLYCRLYMRSRALKRGELHFVQELPPLSVIIVAHNDTENLRRNLPAILEQDYPRFEVIVINDGETSESEECLTLMEDKYPHLYHSFVPDSSRYISHRKLAITLGIKASKYDWLVLTNADCQPQSAQWLRTLARNFTPRTQAVLSYSGYEYSKGWLHRRIAFDNLFTSLRYLGMALAGKPYMGIGRNIAYRKELFYQQKGFSAHLNLQRGDDDLFINSIATAENTRVETAPEAIVRTRPAFRAKEWREEKVGYAATSRLYHGMQRYISGFETLTRLLFHAAWISALVISLLHFHWLAAVLAFFAFLVRFGIQATVINLTAKAVNDRRRYHIDLFFFDLWQPLTSLRWKLSCLFRNKSEFLRK